MFIPSSVSKNIIRKKFKHTTDGKYVFFPGVRPKIFQGYIIKDEKHKELLIKEFEKEYSDVGKLSFIGIIMAATLGFGIGLWIAAVFIFIPFILADHFRHKKFQKIISDLEEYKGPDSSPPLI